MAPSLLLFAACCLICVLYCLICMLYCLFYVVLLDVYVVLLQDHRPPASMTLGWGSIAGHSPSDAVERVDEYCHLPEEAPSEHSVAEDGKRPGAAAGGSGGGSGSAAAAAAAVL